MIKREGNSKFRDNVFKQKHYTCEHCGFVPIHPLGFKPGTKEYKNFVSSLLILDHIKPIALGGEEFCMDNVQVLCLRCNKIKTKNDMKRIIAKRFLEGYVYKRKSVLPLKYPVSFALKELNIIPRIL